MNQSLESRERLFNLLNESLHRDHGATDVVSPRTRLAALHTGDERLGRVVHKLHGDRASKFDFKGSPCHSCFQSFGWSRSNANIASRSVNGIGAQSNARDV